MPRLSCCTPDCLELDHEPLCVSFGRTVHLCTAESLQRFNPFRILRLPLTAARDASDPPRADQSPLGTPTQPLRHPRVWYPIVNECTSSTVHHRAPGFSDFLGFNITLPVPMSPWTLGNLSAAEHPARAIRALVRGMPRHGHVLRPGRPHVKGIGHHAVPLLVIGLRIVHFL